MERDLIDGYVEALTDHLRWRADVSDIVDEVADHLREHADRLDAAGIGRIEAQRRSLERFGEPELVAQAFARSTSGELAAPSRTTRLAGIAGLSAGAAWLIAVALGVTGGHTNLLTEWSLARYVEWTVTLVVALVLTTLTVAGVLRRAGRLFRPAGLTCLAVGGLVTALMVPAAWGVSLTMTLLSVAVLVASRQRGRGPGPAGDRLVAPVRRLALAWVLGAAALLFFDEVRPLGPVDEYGDHPVAWLAPFVACGLCSAWVLVLVGIRLRAERAVTVGPGRC